MYTSGDIRGGGGADVEYAVDCVVCLQDRYRSPKLRSFVDFVVERFS